MFRQIAAWLIGLGTVIAGPTPTPTPLPTPLYKYAIENLGQVPQGKLVVGDGSFEFEIGGVGKKTSGQIRIPDKPGKFPVVVMIRGYQDPATYKSGYGTQRAAGEFVKAGFMTVAPDFLGYGKSDPEAGDIWESRFQTYTTVISLINSLDQLDKWDKSNKFLWAHSNGGQIALYVLEATGRSIPTILWAPVSKSFPYAILSFTDEASDGGKFIRKELSAFEQVYDVDKFAVGKYLDRIKAPLLIQQGTADVDVPYWWSDQLVGMFNVQGVNVQYIKYPGDDHNLRGNWEEVVRRDVKWLEEHRAF